MSPFELKSEAGTILHEQAFPRAFSYFEEMSGVEPPKEDAPDWEFIVAEDTSVTEEGETHA